MVTKKRRASSWLIVGALGVVFGDLGTSPLYALRAVFSASNLALTPANIAGIISLILWSVTVVVSIKYVGLIMRADNKGEGGIMALVGLIKQSNLSRRVKNTLVLCGLIGVSLFYGDSIITPAISVLSAAEGTKLIIPAMSLWIVPTTVVILLGFFMLQSRGTGTIGRLFGPAMLIWFLVSALGGLVQIVAHPTILSAFFPTTAIEFFVAQPGLSFIAMSGVVLAITGVEALYADMGHFGRAPITKAWLWFVFPALALTYLGQGALISHSPQLINSAYFSLFPAIFHIPIIVLAMCATLIASQAVIAGAFSLTRQAIQLGFAPRLLIIHTSAEEAGQVYLPALNWLLATLVAVLVIGFGSSEHLAGAFGMAVSGTLIIDSILFLVVAIFVWKKNRFLIGAIGICLLLVDLLFVTSSASKLLHGAWLPIAIAFVSFTLLSTWYKGRGIVARERFVMEGPLDDFVEKLHRSHVARITGSAVYVGHHANNAPLALHDSVDQLHELHEKVIVVTVNNADVAHIPEDERMIFDRLGYDDDGISHVTLHFGYKDIPNVPLALKHARHSYQELDIEPDTSLYFISNGQPIIVKNRHMASWRKHLYVFMQRNAAKTTEFLKLPLDRTIEMTSYIKL